MTIQLGKVAKHVALVAVGVLGFSSLQSELVRKPIKEGNPPQGIAKGEAKLAKETPARVGEHRSMDKEHKRSMLRNGDKVAFQTGGKYLQVGGESMPGYEKYLPDTTWVTLKGKSKTDCQFIVHKEKQVKSKVDKKETFALEAIKNGVSLGFLKPEKTIFVVFVDKNAKANDADVQMAFEDGKLKFVEMNAYLNDRGNGILRIHSNDWDKTQKLVPAPAKDGAKFEKEIVEKAKRIAAPAGFEEEVGEMDQVSIGATPDGKLFVVGLEKDGDLVVYDPETMAANPWVKTVTVNKTTVSFEKLKKADGVEIKAVKCVAAAADGTFGIIADDGKVYLFDWAKQVFVKVPDIAANASLTLEQLSIGGKSVLCATDFDAKEIYKHDGKGWVAMPKAEGVFVSVGSDGAVVALNKNGRPYKFAKGEWQEIGMMHFDRVAVGSKDSIIGLSDGVMYEWTGKEWKKIGGENLDEIATNGAKTTFVIGENGALFHKGEAAWVVKAAPVKSATVAPAKKAIAGKATKAVTKVDKTGKPVKAAKAIGVKKVAKPKVAAKAVIPAATKSRLQAKKAGKIDIKKAQKTVVAKKVADKAKKPAAKTTKKIVKKLPKKLAKPAAKKATKKPAAKPSTVKKPTVKKVAPKKTTVKKVATKTAAKKPTATKPAPKAVTKKVTTPAVPASAV